jgi:hypothetical protein
MNQLLAAVLACLAPAAGYQAGTALATRHHTRQLIRCIQLYVHHPALRGGLDTNYQPRKEQP